MNDETTWENPNARCPEARKTESNFLHQLISTSDEEVCQKGEAIRRYCYEHSTKEEEIWWNMALYRERGAEAFLYQHLPYDVFESSRSKLRRLIPEGIPEIPLESLVEFRELVSFTSRFVDRVRFLCDFLLYRFLERESGLYRGSQDMHGYIDFFVHRMAGEINKINDIAAFNLFSDLNYRYHQWLTEQAADEDILI